MRRQEGGGAYHNSPGPLSNNAYSGDPWIICPPCKAEGRRSVERDHIMVYRRRGRLAWPVLAVLALVPGLMGMAVRVGPARTPAHTDALPAHTDALPAHAHALPAHAHALPAPFLFAFGREGGNIRPLTVTIGTTGTVTMSAAAGGGRPPGQLSPDALDGLLLLAKAERFFALPAHIVGHGLPDVSSRFISIQTQRGVKTVQVRFVRNAAFEQLYAVLAAAAGVQS